MQTQTNACDMEGDSKSYLSILDVFLNLYFHASSWIFVSLLQSSHLFWLADFYCLTVFAFLVAPK